MSWTEQLCHQLLKIIRLYLNTDITDAQTESVSGTELNMLFHNEKKLTSLHDTHMRVLIGYLFVSSGYFDEVIKTNIHMYTYWFLRRLAVFDPSIIWWCVTCFQLSLGKLVLATYQSVR